MDQLVYKKIIHGLPFGYAMHKIILDSNGFFEDCQYVEVNEQFEKLTGLKRSEIIGERVTKILPCVRSEKFSRIDYYASKVLEQGEVEFVEYSEDFKKWYKIKAYLLDKSYVVTFFIDVTKEIYGESLYKSIFSAIEEGVIAIDLKGNITMLNNTATMLLGVKSQEVLNERISDIFKNEKSKSNMNKMILDLVTVGKSIREGKNLMLVTKKGTSIPIEYNLYPIKDKLGSISGAVISFIDITEKIDKEKEVNYITYHDSLTKVYNRNFFNTKIKDIDIRENLPISIIMGDINGLKLTNDAFGHLVGDELLVAASKVMKRCCKSEDVIVRWGGDEFIIVLPRTNQDDAQKIMYKIKDECGKKSIGVVKLSISLGSSTKYNIENDIMKSIIYAEEAMYKVKILESKVYKSKALEIIMKKLYKISEFEYRHSINVSKICKYIGESMGFYKPEISELEILGKIHDIGKIGISKRILNKKSNLNEFEWNHMKKHPEIGYQILLCSNKLSFLADAIIAHHEWYDGSGYPKGIKGEEIPLKARILSVADAFDVMTSNKSYKKTFSKDGAINELLKLKGKQFDPNIVDVFIENVAEKLDYIK